MNIKVGDYVKVLDGDDYIVDEVEKIIEADSNSCDIRLTSGILIHSYDIESILTKEQYDRLKKEGKQ